VINFRYHVVSIVAVFLALAIGLVLGATELQGTSIDLLTRTNNDLSNELGSVRAQNGLLQQQVNADQAFGQDVETRLLDGLLTSQRVVIVAAPGAPGSVINGVTAAAQQAGASITGQVNLQPKLLDATQSNQAFLSALVQQLVSPDSTPPGGTALQQAAQLLGSALLTKTDPSGSAGGNSGSGNDSGSGSSDSGANRQSVLSLYARAGLLSVSGPLSSSSPPPAATLAIVVIPATAPAGGDNDPANQGLITLSQELNTAGLGTVMAGPVNGSGTGSAINAMRASNVASQISTVDDADTQIGQIVTVEALCEALAGHKAGSYGEDPGNNAAAPDPAPSPAVSTSSTTAHTTGSKNQPDGHSKSKGRS
jgi:Copper transport outer membrane protein, MctB